MAAALLRKCRIFFSEKPAVLRSRSIHTGVWWDFNRCTIPVGCDISGIADNIAGALAKCNYNSTPITFSAYGNTEHYLFPNEDLEALSQRGIQIVDIGFGSSKLDIICGRMIVNDIWFWSKDHPAPANCLIISDDEDLSFALHQLGMRGYNILLAKPQPGKASAVEAAAKTLWQWTSLLAGGPPERTTQ